MSEIRNFLTIDERDFVPNFQIEKIKTLLNQSFANQEIYLKLDNWSSVQNNSWFEIMNESDSEVGLTASINSEPINIFSSDQATNPRQNNRIVIQPKTVLKLFYRASTSPAFYSVKNLTIV